MEKSKNNLIVFGGAGLLVLILIIFGALGTESDPGTPGGSHSGIDADSIPAVSDDDHIRGSRDAAVTLIEYSDIECPFCQDYHEELLSVAVEDKNPEFAWVYRHFPLSRIHPDARRYAVASECAADDSEELFSPFLDALINQVRTETSLSNNDLAAIAAGVGADQSEFQTCINGERTADVVDAEMVEAETAGATGTPFSLFVFKNPLTLAEQEEIQNLFNGASMVFGENGDRLALSGGISAFAIEQLVEIGSRNGAEVEVEEVEETEEN